MKTAGSRRVAERYVKALFDMAESESALDAVERDLRAFGELAEKDNAFAHFLTNPLVPRDHQADVVVTIAAKMGAHEISRQFMAMLARHKRLNILAAIAALFGEWAAKKRGEMRAELVAAAPLDAATVAQVSQQLGKAYGKKITLDVREDKSLLGGVILKVGSRQLDASLAGKLERLGVALKAA